NPASVALRSSAIPHGSYAMPSATRSRSIPKLTLVSSNIPKKLKTPKSL
ncbi:uncharacterized protein METZ01_LOCUS298644, partial [marine metagenome]